jgi:hypothetical protein
MDHQTVRHCRSMALSDDGRTRLHMVQEPELSEPVAKIVNRGKRLQAALQLAKSNGAAEIVMALIGTSPELPEDDESATWVRQIERSLLVAVAAELRNLEADQRRFANATSDTAQRSRLPSSRPGTQGRVGTANPARPRGTCVPGVNRSRTGMGTVLPQGEPDVPGFPAVSL